MTETLNTVRHVFWDQPHASIYLGRQISEMLHFLQPRPSKQPVFVCIGSDRSTGDALGPLVGNELSLLTNFPVLGTLADPVHAKNINEKIIYLQNQYPGAFTIAVDACLGSPKQIGTILVKKGPLKPGLAVKKELPSVGDMQVIGLVNAGGFLDYIVLQSTRLHLVFSMSRTIARALARSCNTYFST